MLLQACNVVQQTCRCCQHDKWLIDSCWYYSQVVHCSTDVRPSLDHHTLHAWRHDCILLLQAGMSEGVL